MLWEYAIKTNDVPFAAYQNAYDKGTDELFNTATEFFYTHFTHNTPTPTPTTVKL